MTDYFIMGAIIAFLAGLWLVGIKADGPEIHFFDMDTSKAMRGFLCLIVILVHIPAAYQNSIQDMIGSFGYIGVTFFFMTSGYGLTISSDRNTDSLRFFWRKRLPKLLIPVWLVNIFFIIIDDLDFSRGISVRKIVGVEGWVQWLLGCYLIFWLSHFIMKKKTWKIPAIVLVIIASICSFYLKTNQIVTSTTWATECYGFIWGILLASVQPKFIEHFKKAWFKKWIFSLVITLILGVGYLIFKPVFFFGDYLLKIMLGVAITMFIFIANVKFHFGNKISLFLGEISFEVYLVHGNVFGVISTIAPNLSSGLFILISLIVTVIIAFVIHSFAQVILKQLAKVAFQREKRKGLK